MTKSPTSDLREVDVSAVNLKSRLAVTVDDEVGDIVTLLDFLGDETSSAEEAEIAIVKWQSGGFSPVVLSDFEVGIARNNQ